LWLRIGFGWWALYSIVQNPFLCTIPLVIKLLPLILRLGMFLGFYLLTHFRLSWIVSKNIIWYFNRMLFLQFLWSNWISYSFTWFSFILVKDLEFGILNWTLLDMPIKMAKNIGYIWFFSLIKSPTFLSLFSFLSLMVVLSI